MSVADKMQSAIRLVNYSWRNTEPSFSLNTILLLSLLLQERNNARQFKHGVHNLGNRISTTIRVAVYALLRLFGTQ